MAAISAKDIITGTLVSIRNRCNQLLFVHLRQYGREKNSSVSLEAEVVIKLDLGNSSLIIDYIVTRWPLGV